MESSVDLGFIDKSEPHLLTNRYFPSKVGGRPAWLDLEKIPETSRLKCKECSGEMLFLCQIYAPIDEHEHCFHRTIFVFICTNGLCSAPNSAKNIKVFRCQLPRENDFYDSEPASEDIVQEEIPARVKLCSVCGCKGTLTCSKCKSVNYCGAAHQKIDWTQGKHKNSCGNTTNEEKGQNDLLFEEYELLIDPEELDSGRTNESEVQAEARQMREYEKFLANQRENVDELSTVPDEEFNKIVNSVDEDETFNEFKKRIEHDKQQVLRYERKGEPLWITDKNIPKKESIPNCQLCGSKRVFEFQIMPQLLNSLNKPDIDWGVIAVYTCEKCCDTNGEYADEFVFKQDIVNDEETK